MLFQLTLHIFGSISLKQKSDDVTFSFRNLHLILTGEAFTIQLCLSPSNTPSAPFKLYPSFPYSHFQVFNLPSLPKMSLFHFSLLKFHFSSIKKLSNSCYFLPLKCSNLSSLFYFCKTSITSSTVLEHRPVSATAHHILPYIYK